MSYAKLTEAYNRLGHIPRFKHPGLPHEMYCDGVDTHTVRVYSFTSQFLERNPTLNLDRDLALSTAADHDRPEEKTGDTVAFIGHRQDKLSGVRQAATELNWDSARINQVVAYEKTAMVLKGELPPTVCPDEFILVAIMDLIDAAQLFHLESVRGRYKSKYASYYPLPDQALIYAPEMLIRYSTVLPNISQNSELVDKLQAEIQNSLLLIVGWWATVEPREISRKWKKTLKNVSQKINDNRSPSTR